MRAGSVSFEGWPSVTAKQDFVAQKSGPAVGFEGVSSNGGAARAVARSRVTHTAKKCIKRMGTRAVLLL